MRETLVKSFGFNSSLHDLPVHALSVPEVSFNEQSFTSPHVPVKNNHFLPEVGLAGSLAVWKVDESLCIVVIEPFPGSTKSVTGVRLKFPHALTCAPLFVALSDTVLQITAAQPGCLLRANVDLIAPTSCLDVVHLRIPSVPVAMIALAESETGRSTSLQVNQGYQCHQEVLFALKDGECGLASFENSTASSDSYQLFIVHSRIRSAHRRQISTDLDRTTADPDLVPQRDAGGNLTESDLSSTSHQSVASSTSRGSFISRLFRVNQQESEALRHRASNASNFDLRRDGASHSVSRLTSLRSRTGSLPESRHANDPVLSMQTVEVDKIYFATLHNSGLIRMFGQLSNGTYSVIGELFLSVNLVQGYSQYLLVPEPSVLLAVLTVDRDPFPHALCVYRVQLSVQDPHNLSMVSSKICQRDGPFDRISSAVYDPFVSSIVLATETGVLSAVQISSGGADPFEASTPTFERADGQGLDRSFFWTYLDDLIDDSGVWHIYDELDQSLYNRLLAPRRFSIPVVAKALRLPLYPDSTMKEVTDVLREFSENGSSEDGNRLILRAQRYANVEDVPVLALGHARGIGTFVFRRAGVFILRTLLKLEKDYLSRGNFARFDDSDSNFDAISLRQVRRIVSSNAVPQIASVRFAVADAESRQRKDSACVLSIALRGSMKFENTAIHELFICNSNMHDNMSDFRNFASGAAHIADLIIPGASLLQFLASKQELRALREASMLSSEKLPISSLYSMGLVCLGDVDEHVSRSGDVMHVEVAEPKPIELNDDDIGKKALGDAFSSFVAASKIACKALSSGQERNSSDIRCAAKLSGALDREINACGEPLRHGNVENHIDFWLLERSLRLFDGPKAAKHAAAIALEAMSVAPDSKYHEMMRAAAFGRFLDVQDFDNALRTILKEPLESQIPPLTDPRSAEGASALRDCMTLLVNAAIDRNRFSWLLKRELSRPLKTIVAGALERRARSTEILSRSDLIGEPCSPGKNVASEYVTSGGKADPTSSLYEYLLSWQLSMDNLSGAASCVAERAIRICSEGLAIALDVASESTVRARFSALDILLSWAKSKSQAFATACALCRLLPCGRRYIQLAKPSFSKMDLARSQSGCIPLEELSRIHLLARAQTACIRKKIASKGDATAVRTASADYIVTHASQLLACNTRGLNFAISTLIAPPTSWNDVQLALELAVSWADIGGSDNLSHAVRTATIMLSRDKALCADSLRLSVTRLSHMLDMLSSILTASKGIQCKNLHAAAAEGLLEAFGGTVGLPHWLTDAATWGILPSDSCSEIVSKPSPRRKLHENPAKMICAFLRFNRPIDALQTVLSRLEEMLSSPRAVPGTLPLPYSAIEGALQVLLETTKVDDLAAHHLREKLQICIDEWTEKAKTKGESVNGFC